MIGIEAASVMFTIEHPELAKLRKGVLAERSEYGTPT